MQPQLNPSTNSFNYRQLSTLDNLYRISGNYAATNIQQIPVSTLDNYNASNSTSFGVKTKEKLIVPITNETSTDIPLSFTARNTWTSTINGSVISWLNPVFAVWKANSDEIDIQYRRGEYAVLFGDDQRWDVNMFFWGVVTLSIAAIPES